MKPNRKLPLIDSPRFRFVFISTMLGFVVAAWVCASKGIFDTLAVLVVSLIAAGQFAIAGFVMHFLLLGIKSSATAKRQANFAIAIIAMIGLVASSVAMRYFDAFAYNYLHLFFKFTYLVMVGVLAVFSIWFISSMCASLQFGFEQGKIRRQLNYEEHMRRKARYKRSVDLNKQDYDTRLTRFVAHTQGEPESTNMEDPAQEEPFVSKMPFWQRSTFQIGKLPKPVDLIRVLLHRISKAVYQGKSS